MSEPPADPNKQSDLSGFQPLNPPNPPDDSERQPEPDMDSYDPYFSPHQPPPVKPQISGAAIAALVISVLAIVAIVLVIIVYGRAPVGSSQTTPYTPDLYPNSGPVSPAPMPDPTSRIDVGLVSVSEAIDIASGPSLGRGWDASDGRRADDSLQLEQFITPCGVLVDVFTPGDDARIVGYEISTGLKAWSVPLQRATGLDLPEMTQDNPTYTLDCQMVLTFDDINISLSTHVGLMVDLSSGKTTVLAFNDDLASCGAALGTLACQYADEIEILSLADPTIIQRSIPTFGYTTNGDVVVDSMVSSELGYQNPTTGGIVFGRDVQTGGWKTNDTWVVYKEPYSVDGFLSGKAVRVEGPLSGDAARCSFIAWDTSTDTGLWSTPASIPCGLGSSAFTQWTIAGSVLMVHNGWLDKGDPESVQAFSWADGSLLWQSGTDLGYTAWRWANTHTASILGLTSDNMIFQKDYLNQQIVRITDGATIPLSIPVPVMTLTETMAYARIFVADDPSQTTMNPYLAGFSIDGTSDPVWTVKLPDDVTTVWTFAVDTTMYVVYKDSSEQIWVSQLVE